MRLIDADTLNFEGQKYSKMQLLGILEFVEKQPTAYDVEAKVAELEKVSFERFGNDGMGGQKVVSLDDAIEIFRGKE